MIDALPMREARGASVVVIPCGAKKQPQPCPARDLYIGSAFRLARAAAEADGRRWLILSGLHGLLDPDQEVAPYNVTLRTKADENRLVLILRSQPNPGPVEAWTPARYTSALRRAGIIVTAAPLDGLTMGWQAHWYKERASR